VKKSLGKGIGEPKLQSESRAIGGKERAGIVADVWSRNLIGPPIHLDLRDWMT
jgi:hypothetical protein